MKVRVNQSPVIETAKVNHPTLTQVVAVGIQGPSGVATLSDAGDVDMTNLDNGSILIYKTATNKWTSSTHLESQIVEGGEY